MAGKRNGKRRKARAGNRQEETHVRGALESTIRRTVELERRADALADRVHRSIEKSHQMVDQTHKRATESRGRIARGRKTIRTLGKRDGERQGQ